ncbi:hypothetical protein BN1708_019482, partial [Verticillium longisporum]
GPRCWCARPYPRGDGPAARRRHVPHRDGHL